MYRFILCIAFITTSLITGCSSDPATDNSGLPIVDGTDNGGGATTGDGSTTGNNTINSNLSPVPLDTIREDLLNDLAGYQSEILAEKLYELVANVSGASTGVQMSGTIVNTNTVSFDVPSSRTSFDCPIGGTMVIENIDAEESQGGGASETNDYNRYEFQQCVTTISGGSLPDGNYSLNGNYTYETLILASSRGFARTTVATWDSFSLLQADEQSYEFIGTLTLSTTSNAGSAMATRNSEILRYVESNTGTILLALTDVDFLQQRRPIPNVGGSREVLINGTYTGPLSPGATLEVSTDPEFTESTVGDPDFDEALTGSLQITSTDGGILTMVANGPLKISFLSADGTASETILEELPLFDFRGTGCVPGGDFINEMTVESCSF